MTTEALFRIVEQEINLVKSGVIRKSVALAWIQKYLEDYTFDGK